MVRAEKIEKVNDVKENLDSSTAFYLCDYTGLTVAEMSELRRKLRDKAGLFKVVKNSSLYFALKDKNFDEMLKYVAGPIAVLFAHQDELEPLKTAYEFSEEVSKMSFKAGWVDGKVYGPQEINTIAKLPGKNELRAMLVCTLNAPIFKLVYALNWPLQALVSTLEQVRKQKEEVK
ncbi:MAG TPA: 50S ribosomal protein L10 [Candidatus Hydrothermia bacterium]|nr:50S ribosomal protein L10 [Candidatus Hydrothermae bacterium]MDD3648915.1 50S ribosomal protein L10 [Candidatus Hydrothermia bacterium]MDD5572601.1 50S ribosomal protein L10 [Candidatus Hydrothermia bacterium]HOK23156.1 50S ribosomal protein L10 [Candidatus Hydrothermia bacterium]HOL23860.1 50S ribosomal protein L10 [Candidatus Hydrothermia bacterium]